MVGILLDYCVWCKLHESRLFGVNCEKFVYAFGVTKPLIFAFDVLNVTKSCLAFIFIQEGTFDFMFYVRKRDNFLYNRFHQLR